MIRNLLLNAILVSTAFAQKVEEPPAETPPKAVIVEEDDEAVAKEQDTEKITLHTIKPGGSLTAVSEEAYGRTRYWRILKLYNDVDPSKLQVGQEIKAPDIPWLLSNCGLQKKFPDAVSNILSARETLTKIEDRKAPLTKEDQAAIKEAAEKIAATQKLLLKDIEGVSGKPNATVKQLRTVHKNLLHIANKTREGKTDPNSLAHEHLSNAIVYGVLWAQGGFK